MATKIVCGFCSLHQSSANKKCECGKEFKKQSSQHWEVIMKILIIGW